MQHILRSVAIRAMIKERQKTQVSPAGFQRRTYRARGELLSVTHNNPSRNLQENSRVGDRFMNQIEPMAAYVPYMTCPGNHEEAW